MVAVLLPRLVGHQRLRRPQRLHSVVAHSRLDADIEGEDDLVAAADELDG